jgi:hypothetical protein
MGFRILVTSLLPGNINRIFARLWSINSTIIEFKTIRFIIDFVRFFPFNLSANDWPCVMPFMHLVQANIRRSEGSVGRRHLIFFALLFHYAELGLTAAELLGEGNCIGVQVFSVLVVVDFESDWVSSALEG